MRTRPGSRRTRVAGSPTRMRSRHRAVSRRTYSREPPSTVRHGCWVWSPEEAVVVEETQERARRKVGLQLPAACCEEAPATSSRYEVRGRRSLRRNRGHERTAPKVISAVSGCRERRRRSSWLKRSLICSSMRTKRRRRRLPALGEAVVETKSRRTPMLTRPCASPRTDSVPARLCRDREFTGQAGLQRAGDLAEHEPGRLPGRMRAAGPSRRHRLADLDRVGTSADVAAALRRASSAWRRWRKRLRAAEAGNAGADDRDAGRGGAGGSAPHLRHTGARGSPLARPRPTSLGRAPASVTYLVPQRGTPSSRKASVSAA
jgi:hypothetical protein